MSLHFISPSERRQRSSSLSRRRARGGGGTGEQQVLFASDIVPVVADVAEAAASLLAAEAAGTRICVHGRQKRRCKPCSGGADSNAEEGDEATEAAGLVAPGTSICVHGRQKRRCGTCGGGGSRVAHKGIGDEEATPSAPATFTIYVQPRFSREGQSYDGDMIFEMDASWTLRQVAAHIEEETGLPQDGLHIRVKSEVRSGGGREERKGESTMVVERGVSGPYAAPCPP